MTDLHTLPDANAATPFLAGPCGNPDDVLNHPGLGVAEKRAVLASWASDRNAVPGVPTLRQVADGSIVSLDDILRALQTLDAGGGSTGNPARSGAWKSWPFERSRHSVRGRRLTAPWRLGRDDDDDPPPAPACAALPPRGGGGAGAASLEPMAA